MMPKTLQTEDHALILTMYSVKQKYGPVSVTKFNKSLAHILKFLIKKGVTKLISPTFVENIC